MSGATRSGEYRGWTLTLAADEVVARAIATVRATCGEAVWGMLTPKERTTLIYREIHRLDIERTSGMFHDNPERRSAAIGDVPIGIPLTGTDGMPMGTGF